jgi:hypothetical protein
MNSTEFARPADDDTRFDRLVDGELTPEEYQTLLESLDDEPAGWRRCALAFLEAQALSQELIGIRRTAWQVGARGSGVFGGDPHSGKQKSNPPKTPDPVAQNSARFAGWQQLLLLAACCLVALSLGIVLPDFWQTENPAPPSGPGIKLAHDNAADKQPEMLLPRSIGNARLMLSGPGGTQTEAGELPIIEYPDDPRRWLGPNEPGLPVSLVNELKRRGHQVQRQEQYVPVDLEDGRKAVIPVETIQITPVSRRAY